MILVLVLEATLESNQHRNLHTLGNLLYIRFYILDKT